MVIPTIVASIVIILIVSLAMLPAILAMMFDRPGCSYKELWKASNLIGVIVLAFISVVFIFTSAVSYFYDPVAFMNGTYTNFINIINKYL